MKNCIDTKDIVLEKRLAINLSQLFLNGEDIAQIRNTLKEKVNWDYFVNFCNDEGVAGLVWRNLKDVHRFDSWIAENTNPLKYIYENNQKINLQLLQNFDSLLQGFEKEKIPIILLQGMALFNLVYQDLGVRALGDIDILIRKEHLHKLANHLNSRGYKNINNYPHLFYCDKALLDIHTDIANIDRIKSRKFALFMPAENLWQDSITEKRNRPLTRLLSLEDMILALCAHLQKHSYSRLIWFVDIHEIMNKYKEDIDWEKLDARALEFNLLKPLYFSLKFIEYHWHNSYSMHIASHLQDIQLNYIQQKALKKIIHVEKIDRWGDMLFLFEIKNWRQKFYFIIETLFPRPGVMAQIFNISHPLLYLVAYPMRLWQIFILSFKSLFSWISKKLDWN
jgi:hypothetical protein